MPRVEVSKAGQMIGFFRTADLDTAELVLGLCTDEVRSRRQKSNAAKQRAQADAATGATAAAAPKAAKAKKGKKKAAPKQPAAPAAQTGTAAGPAPSPVAQDAGAGVEEAGDLVVT